MYSFEKMSTEVERVFHICNEHFYNNELEEPIIVIQSRGRKSNTMGWFTCDKVWKDKTAAAPQHEITICYEYLNYGPLEICETLLHEMVHLYNSMNGIQDCSRSGTYHNKHFKEAAESHGLIVKKMSGHGWAYTALSTEARHFLEKNINHDLFTLTYKDHDFKERVSPPECSVSKSSSRKYVCPTCGCIVRATKKVHILCGDCNEAYQECI